MAVPLNIHSQMRLIIFRLQAVSDHVRKMFSEIFYLTAFQRQARGLTVTSKLYQIGGAGINSVIQIQRRDAAAGAFGNLPADTDQNNRTVIFVYQS